MVWTRDDIIPGMYLVASKKSVINDDGYLVTVCSKVGWHAARSIVEKTYQVDGIVEDGDYCLIAMNDGMMSTICNRNTFVKYLNQNGNFRHATHDEMLRILNHQRSLVL